MPQQRFNVGMSNSSDGHNKRRVSLRIEDRLSGEIVFDCDFTAEQFTAMLGNHYLSGVEAFITPHPERIGKARTNTSLPMHYAQLGNVGYGKEQAVAEALAEEHLCVLNDENPGWEIRSVSKTNYGWNATFDRWDEPTEADLEKAKGSRF